MLCRKSLVLLSLGAALLVSGYLALAGPLNPAGGPVAPTYKTLTEVEPRTLINVANTPGDADSIFKITQPGSYYLGGSVTGVANKHGIEIVASGVTLDLNGFDLAGVPGMGLFDGVSVTVNNLTNITVINGSVRNWGDGGVDLGFLSNGCRVAGVLASGNAGIGINASIACTVSNCSATFNAGSGFRTVNGSTVSNCSAFNNSGTGIFVTNGCTVSICSTYFNAAGGIVLGASSTVTDCSAFSNMGNGIQLSGDCTAAHCTAESNTASGIDAGAGSTVADCIAGDNTLDGIRGADGVTISGCSTHSNTLNGINVASSFTVTKCTAYVNTGSGILAGSSGSITDCLASANTLDGIRCNGGCLIRGNACASNGNGGDGAGIHTTTGSDGRIEGNDCTRNDRGIDVDGAGNLIIRNTCSSNTINWTIAANNVVGPILDRTAPGSAVISGNSAPDSTGSTHPNANFTY